MHISIKTAFVHHTRIRSPHSLFNGRDVFRLNFPFRQELGGYPSLKQQPLFGHLDQDESNQLSHVHPTGHLLKPEQSKTQQAFSDEESWIQFALVTSSSLFKAHNRTDTLLLLGWSLGGLYPIFLLHNVMVALEEQKQMFSRVVCVGQ